MKSNEYFSKISNKWISFINFCGLIMSLFFLLLNIFSLIIQDYINYNVSLIQIFSFTIIELVLCIISSISIRNNKEKKTEYIVNLIFLLICSLPVIYYPNFTYLLVLPSLSILTSTVFKNYKMVLSFYIINILLIFLTFIRNFNFEINLIFNYLIYSILITFISKISLEISEVFVLEEKHIKNITRKNLSLEKEIELEPLTKLFNKKALYKDLEKIFKETKKEDIMPCIIMIDLDYFKRINDTYGHINGDKALLSLTNIINKKISKNFLAYRFGGEEFAIVIKNEDLNKVYGIIEDMRKDFSNIKHEYLNNDYVTFSAGIACYKYKKDIYEWIKEADEALYQAKNEGRNKTVLYKG